MHKTMAKTGVSSASHPPVERSEVKWAGPSVASELDLASGEGLLLHGYGAVAAQHSDRQLPLPVVGLLVPLVHRQRIKRWDQSHLSTSQENSPITF